jgi:tRNA(adenine34) deaminase
MTDSLNDQAMMQQALLLAKQAAEHGEVPVGAVLVDASGEVVAKAYNQPIGLHDPTAHAEVLALREAANKLGNYRLSNTTLYVTLEPCAMCLGAMVHARVKRVVFGAHDPKSGVCGTARSWANDEVFNHQLLCEGGVLEADCAAVLKAFFASRR